MHVLLASYYCITNHPKTPSVIAYESVGQLGSSFDLAGRTRAFVVSCGLGG